MPEYVFYIKPDSLKSNGGNIVDGALIPIARQQRQLFKNNQTTDRYNKYRIHSLWQKSNKSIGGTTERRDNCC